MNIEKQYQVLTIISFLLIVSAGCVQDDLKELEDKEKKIISTYLADNNISEDTKTEGGIYFVEKNAGSGISPVMDNYVLINFVGRDLETLTIRETSYDSLKAEWPAAANFDDYYYGPVKIQYGHSMPGINEALAMMKEGGKALVVIPSDKANYDYKPLLYEFELLKVIGKIEKYEDSLVNVYADRYFGDTTRIDTVDIWTRTIEDGTGEEINATDTLYFNFTGHLVQEYGDSIHTRIFDSNADLPPVKMLYGQKKIITGKMIYNNALPQGLKRALDSTAIRENTRSSVLLGYDQAFTDDGVIQTEHKYIIVPKYQSVLYTIDVTAIRRGPAK